MPFDSTVPRLESEVEKVQESRRLRLDILYLDEMVPRPFKRRPRPKTAIIAEAAKRLAEARSLVETEPSEVT
jgi:hypothetical protein